MPKGCFAAIISSKQKNCAGASFLLRPLWLISSLISFSGWYYEVSRLGLKNHHSSKTGSEVAAPGGHHANTAGFLIPAYPRFKVP